MMKGSGNEARPSAMPREEERFDAASVRRILQCAAEEQYRLDIARSDAYSRGELEEMAAETGISPKALGAAIEAERERFKSEPHAMNARGERPRGWLAWLEDRLPANWPRPARRALLLSGGAAALFALLASLPVIGPVVLWAGVIILIVLSLLLLLGVSFV